MFMHIQRSFYIMLNYLYDNLFNRVNSEQILAPPFAHGKFIFLCLATFYCVV